MNEGLIKVTERNGKSVVSAKALYGSLGYNTSQYSRWAKQCIVENGFFEENVDWVLLDINAENQIINQYGESKDYEISDKMACDIVSKMKYNENAGIILKELGGLSVFHTSSRFEESFGSMLEVILNSFGIEMVCQYRVGEFEIDFYLPQFNIAIEYDEIHHVYNKEADYIREVKIVNEIGCEFIRLDFRDKDSENVGRVLNRILTIKK